MEIDGPEWKHGKLFTWYLLDILFLQVMTIDGLQKWGGALEAGTALRNGVSQWHV